jgi:hypothetical protein
MALTSGFRATQSNPISIHLVLLALAMITVGREVGSNTPVTISHQGGKYSEVVEILIATIVKLTVVDLMA